MCVSSGKLLLHQMRDNLIHQAFSLVGAADGQTAERIIKTASSGYDIHIIVKNAAGVIKIYIPADSLISQKPVN